VSKSKKSKAKDVLVQSQVKKITLLKEQLRSCEDSLRTPSIKLRQLQEANKRLSRKSNIMYKKSWSEYSAQYKQR